MGRKSGVTAEGILNALKAAAECSLPDLVSEQLAALQGPFLHDASLPEQINALELVERMARGHIPGFQPDSSTRERLDEEIRPTLLATALDQVEGLAGSDKIEDARALLALVRRAEPEAESASDGGLEADGRTRLRWTLERLSRDGSPLMQGAAGAVLVLLGYEEAFSFSERLGSWIDLAFEPAAQRALARRISGVLLCAAPLLESASLVMDGLINRVAALDDAEFLRRLPALREGFDVLSPASRGRFLAALSDRLGPIDMRLDFSPELLTRWAEADYHGRQAVLARDPEIFQWTSTE
jgi:hypothetical protein